MNAIASRISFTVGATTRDDCIAKMDEIGLAFLDFVGGAPWVAIDDDFKKVQPSEPITLTDDQGFMYLGQRTYIFKGPNLKGLSQPTYPGFEVQKGIDTDG
jgi:hypothetical protein